MTLPFGMILAAGESAPSDPTTTYVIMGGACLFIVYTMTRMTKRNGRKGDPMETPFAARSLAQTRAVERDMENLLVELQKMAQKMSAQLDTRAAKLEALIQDADERLARLEAANRQAPPRPDFALPPEPVPAAVEPPMAKPVRPPAEEPNAPPAESAHAEVYRLADDGRTVAHIAAELNRPSGEVELILALRSRT